MGKERELELALHRLKEAEEEFGIYHPDLTGYLEELARVYESMGEQVSAERCYERILMIWERAFVPEYGLRRFLGDVLGSSLSARAPEILYEPREVIMLEDSLLLGVGDNRVCYVHPDDPSLCIKIDKPWNVGFHNNRKKRIKRVFMPWLADFSSNREEARFYWRKARRLGEDFYAHAPRYYGIVTTNLGPGLVVERVLDYDGTPSARLDTYLENYPEEVDHVLELLEELLRYLLETELYVYVWNSENLIVQKGSDGDRIVVIDWKSESRPNNDFPLAQVFPLLAKRKMKRECFKLKDFVKKYKK